MRKKEHSAAFKFKVDVEAIKGEKTAAELCKVSMLSLEMGLKTGHCPKIINSDQGCQFTSQEWLYAMSLLGIRVSMDGKGRCLDKIPIERFWRTLKYEEVYLNSYENIKEAKDIVPYRV